MATIRPVAIVGTPKGLFLLQGNIDRSKWEVLGLFLKGLSINHAVYDKRNGRIYATANSVFFGSEVV